MTGNAVWERGGWLLIITTSCHLLCNLFPLLLIPLIQLEANSFPLFILFNHALSISLTTYSIKSVFLSKCLQSFYCQTTSVKVFLFPCQQRGRKIWLLSWVQNQFIHRCFLVSQSLKLSLFTKFSRAASAFSVINKSFSDCAGSK